MTLLTIDPPELSSLQDLYRAAKDQWLCCNWQTAVGPRKLNLKNLRPRQTRLLAEATSGEEAAAWDEATRFLEAVERDAKTAGSSANRAMLLVAAGRLSDAIEEIETALQLEAKYRTPGTWKPLCDAIHEAARAVQ